MSKRLLILGSVAVLAAGLLWSSRDSSGPAPPGQTATAKGIERHAFLDGLPLDEGGFALMLYPQITGSGLRVVRDQDALRQAQGVAYFTDNPRALLKRTFLSILFMSPPGMPPSNAFVSIVKDKQVRQTFTCYRAFCEGTERFDPPHEREMAGLLEASEPVELITETYHHHDKARAAMFKLMRDADVVQIEPPNLPPPNSIVFPRRVALTLPAILLETDETGHAPLEPLDEARLEAMFRAAFTHAYPETDAYRLGEIRVSTYFPSNGGWPIVQAKDGAQVRTADGHRLGLDRILVLEPRVIIDLTPRIAVALRGADAFDEMPAFLPPEPPSVAARLDQMAEAHYGRPCPGCFRIELPVAAVDTPHVADRPPPSFPLSYYRITSP